MREARRVIRGVNVPVHGTFPAMRVGGPVRDGVAGGQDRMVGECGWLGEGRSCEHAIAYGTTDSLTVSVCW